MALERVLDALSNRELRIDLEHWRSLLSSVYVLFMSTEDDFDHSMATHEAAAVRISSLRLVRLHEIERLLLADYARTGAAEYQECAQAVRAILVDAAAWRPEITAAEMGRRGGSKTSAAKVAAGRVNGKKGGRPRRLAPSPATQLLATPIKCMRCHAVIVAAVAQSGWIGGNPRPLPHCDPCMAELFPAKQRKKRATVAKN